MGLSIPDLLIPTSSPSPYAEPQSSDLRVLLYHRADHRPMLEFSDYRAQHYLLLESPVLWPSDHC